MSRGKWSGIVLNYRRRRPVVYMPARRSGLTPAELAAELRRHADRPGIDPRTAAALVEAAWHLRKGQQ